MAESSSLSFDLFVKVSVTILGAGKPW